MANRAHAVDLFDSLLIGFFLRLNNARHVERSSTRKDTEFHKALPCHCQQRCDEQRESFLTARACGRSNSRIMLIDITIEYEKFSLRYIAYG